MSQSKNKKRKKTLQAVDKADKNLKNKKRRKAYSQERKVLENVKRLVRKQMKQALAEYKKTNE
jgi:hypothetical protein